MKAEKERLSDEILFLSSNKHLFLTHESTIEINLSDVLLSATRDLRECMWEGQCLTDGCYDSKRKIECSRKFPLCTTFMRLIFDHNLFKFMIFLVGYIVSSEHVRFSRLILFAMKIFAVGFERVEYGRTNQQIAVERERFERSLFFSIVISTYLNVETISVRVRTFCFFILASSTHLLGQH